MIDTATTSSTTSESPTDHLFTARSLKRLNFQKEEKQQAADIKTRLEADAAREQERLAREEANRGAQILYQKLAQAANKVKAATWALSTARPTA